MKAWLPVLLAACGAPPEAIAPTAPTAPTAPVARTTDAPPPVDALTDPDPTADLPFEALALDVAARTQLTVVAWGAIALAPTPGLLARLADPTQQRSGAYLLDVSGQRWLISFVDDGRTGAFPRSAFAGARPAWSHWDEHTLDHAQGHHHGVEDISMTVFDGRLVVLSHEYEGDVTDPDDQPTFEGYTCPDCPPVTGLPNSYFLRTIIGPAFTAADLSRTFD